MNSQDLINEATMDLCVTVLTVRIEDIYYSTEEMQRKLKIDDWYDESLQRAMHIEAFKERFKDRLDINDDKEWELAFKTYHAMCEVGDRVGNVSSDVSELVFLDGHSQGRQDGYEGKPVRHSHNQEYVSGYRFGQMMKRDGH